MLRPLRLARAPRRDGRRPAGARRPLLPPRRGRGGAADARRGRTRPDDAERRGHRPVRGVVPGWTGEPLTVDYRLRVRWKDGRDGRGGRRVPVRADPERLRPAPDERGDAAARATRSSGAHPMHCGIDRRRALRGVGAQRRARQRGRRLQPVGRARPPDAAAAAARRVGDLHARASGRARSTSSSCGRRPATVFTKADPYAMRFELPPRSASVVVGAAELRVGRPRVDGGAPPPERLARSADVGLRGAPRVVGARRRRRALPLVPRAGRAARALRRATWASRTSSCCR